MLCSASDEFEVFLVVGDGPLGGLCNAGPETVKLHRNVGFLKGRCLCPDSSRVFQCLIIGAGPCGLRTAIDLSLLGAKVVVIEKRDAFSRNNVLHLWPFTIHDLRGLGAKKFYGKFCAGAIDHISE